MNLTALSQKREIDTAQKKLLDLFSEGEERGNKVIAHLGMEEGGSGAPTYYHREHDFWTSFFTIENSDSSRYWFGYGLGDPNSLRKISPICEINIPIAGANRKIAGAFARDNAGGVYLVHSGKIGGGRKGIGSSAFWERYSGNTINIVYSTNRKPHKAALIGKLGSHDLLEHIGSFVRQVGGIKDDIVRGKRYSPEYSRRNVDSDMLSSAYAPEHQGKKAPYTVTQMVEAQSYHGSIVDALEKLLAEFKPVNDKKRDLYIKSKQNEIDSLFEVKADCSQQSIYTGIGQLIVNSDISTRNRFLVIYAPKSDMLDKKLEPIGITVVPFRWEDEQVIFTKSEQLLKMLRKK